MFNTAHILYMVISFVISAGLLVLFGLTLKKQKYKNLILIIFAVLTVVLHYSVLWVDYFQTGEAKVDNTMLLAVYPCNVVMWLLLIVALMKNKTGKVFKVLAESTFYIGIIGGVVGIVFNEIYASTPTLADWDVLKGLLSHSTMIIGCVYLLVGGYIKIRVSNTISVVLGGLLLLVDGGLVIGLFTLCKMDSPNCMYLLENPFPQLAWFNTYLIGLLVGVLVFGITAIYEQLALEKEERWYCKIKNYIASKKSKEEEK